MQRALDPLIGERSLLFRPMRWWQQTVCLAVAKPAQLVALWIRKPSGFPFSEQQLRCLAPGTVGKALANQLDANGLHLMQNYESHDLIHILTGYGMDLVGEYEMQAFILGNRCGRFRSRLILAFGILTLPDQWHRLNAAFLRGRAISQRIYHLPLHQLCALPLLDARKLAGLA